MSKLTLFVGLDYHSTFVQVCVLDGHGKMRLNRKVNNCGSWLAPEQIRELRRLIRFRDQLVPSSGERQADAGLVKAGSPLLRSVIIETVHRLVGRIDSHWAKLASKMLKRGKPRCVVVAAIANRWVRWLHHQLTVEGLAS